MSRLGKGDFNVNVIELVRAQKLFVNWWWRKVVPSRIIANCYCMYPLAHSPSTKKNRKWRMLDCHFDYRDGVRSGCIHLRTRNQSTIRVHVPLVGSRNSRREHKWMWTASRKAKLSQTESSIAIWFSGWMLKARRGDLVNSLIPPRSTSPPPPQTLHFWGFSCITHSMDDFQITVDARIFFSPSIYCWFEGWSGVEWNFQAAMTILWAKLSCHADRFPCTYLNAFLISALLYH